MPEPTKPSALTAKLRAAVAKEPPPRKREPLWHGPQSNTKLGGVTFSMLNRFLSCRERFRLYAMEGLRPTDGFNHKIEYGQMWHVCEEALAKAADDGVIASVSPVWVGPLREYVRELCREYPMQQEQIVKWYNVCSIQFPVYVDYWRKHPDVKHRQPLFAEYVFTVPYRLPSGRVVYLKGKYDSVDLVGSSPKAARIWLQENKTKGDIEEDQMQRQLTADLQTMIYLITLRELQTEAAKQGTKSPFPKSFATAPIEGVRYNVVRRPLSGGEGDIKQKKGSKNDAPETEAEYYGRLQGVIDGTGLNSKGEPYKGPPHWFMRWNVVITAHDTERFKARVLNPLLEQLCDWFEFVSGGDPWRPSDDHRNRVPGDPPEHFGIHWQHPFGCTNYLDEGGSSDVDHYLMTGSEVGLRRVDTLFNELV
jgi:hypothetical protein